jgi:hypothetical protein
MIDRVGRPGSRRARIGFVHPGFATRLEACAPSSVRETKRLVQASLATPQAARALARDAFGEMWFDSDHREFQQALAEDRPPRFVRR